MKALELKQRLLSLAVPALGCLSAATAGFWLSERQNALSRMVEENAAIEIRDEFCELLDRAFMAHARLLMAEADLWMGSDGAVAEATVEVRESIERLANKVESYEIDGMGDGKNLVNALDSTLRNYRKMVAQGNEAAVPTALAYFSTMSLVQPVPPVGRWKAQGSAFQNIGHRLHGSLNTLLGAAAVAQLQHRAQAELAQNQNQGRALIQGLGGEWLHTDQSVEQAVFQSLNHDLEILASEDPEVSRDFRALAERLVSNEAFVKVYSALEQREPLGDAYPESAQALKALADSITLEVDEIRAMFKAARHAEISFARLNRGFALGVFLGLLAVMGYLLYDFDRKRRRLERQLLRQAEFDSMTRLPNRLAFENALDDLFSAGLPGSTAIVLADIDDFKQVNDGYGHQTGDTLLREFARLLSETVRAPSRTFRIGGDEFAVVFPPGVKGSRGPDALVQKLNERMRDPILVSTQKLWMSASFGIATCEHPMPAHSLLAQADIALYEAKERGKNRAVVYEESSQGPLTRKIPSLLADGRLSLAVQPQVCLSSGRVLGMEVLCRWPDEPGIGTQSIPATIEHIERHGGTEQFLHLLTARLDQTAILLDSHFRGRYWLNIWPSQLLARSSDWSVGEVFDSMRLDHTRLGLELASSRPLRRLVDVKAIIDALKERGIGLVLDQFGLESSHSGPVMSLPIDGIKVDSRLNNWHGRSSANLHFLRGLVAMADERDLSICASSVERAKDLGTFAELGFDYVQGNAICPPLAPEELVERLKSQPNLDVSRDPSRASSDRPAVWTDWLKHLSLPATEA